ncbi:hypothetical protein BDW69DRAFT_190400 [Aspergillus filifer]
MTDTTHSEVFTPLDLVTPPLYIRLLLAFSANERTVDVRTALYGLDILCDQLPWLGGLVLKPSPNSRLHVHYGNAINPIIVDRGSVASLYLELVADLTPPRAILLGVSPVPAMVDKAPFCNRCIYLCRRKRSISVLEIPSFEDRDPLSTNGDILFQFADIKAVGICMCMHRNEVDAPGFAEALDIWLRMLHADIKEQFRNPFGIKHSIHADTAEEIAWENILSVASGERLHTGSINHAFPLDGPEGVPCSRSGDVLTADGASR